MEVVSLLLMSHRKPAEVQKSWRGFLMPSACSIVYLHHVSCTARLQEKDGKPRTSANAARKYVLPVLGCPGGGMFPTVDP